MARVGLVLNLLGALVVTTLVYTVGTVVFGIDPSVVPEWAASLATGSVGM